MVAGTDVAPATHATSLHVLHARFLSILPRIELHGCVCFRHLRCPHRREDAVQEMVALCWKWFVPLSFGAFLLTALLMVVPIPSAAQLGISVATFAVWGYLMYHFVQRVRFNMRESRVPVHLNPFL